MNGKNKTILLYVISIIVILIFSFAYCKVNTKNINKKIDNTVSINNEANMLQEENEIITQKTEKINEIEDLPTPDRIVYKNQKNEYKIINVSDLQYAKIYNELAKRMKNNISGKSLSEDEISNMQNNGSFIEFDYDKKSKNFVFMLDENDIGIIKRLSDSGQVIQNSLENVENFKNEINKIVDNKVGYTFDKNLNYTTTMKKQNIPNDFEQKRVGIYQKHIQNNSSDYKNSLKALNCDFSVSLPEVDFSKQSVIITISEYQINSVKQNIGNIKYEFGYKLTDYTVNVLIISKVVNSKCIYYNISDSAKSYQTTNTELPKIVNNTASGIIKNISNNKIEIGLNDSYSTYMLVLQDSTSIINYETKQAIGLNALEKGDLIYVFWRNDE